MALCISISKDVGVLTIILKDVGLTSFNIIVPKKPDYRYM